MKIRTGFVSNSSSSSFIAIIEKNGELYEEGWSNVSATVGFGFIAEWNDDEDHYYDGDDIFIIHPSEEGKEWAFIRPFSHMRDKQTLAGFKAETTRMFKKKFGTRTKNIHGPQFIAAGSVGTE